MTTDDAALAVIHHLRATPGFDGAYASPLEGIGAITQAHLWFEFRALDPVPPTGDEVKAAAVHLAACCIKYLTSFPDRPESAE